MPATASSLEGEARVAQVKRSAATSAFALAAATIVLVFALHGPSLVALARTWSESATYGHGWLVLPVAGWLAWRDRARLVESTSAPSPLAFVFLVPMALAWLVLQQAELQALAQPLVPAIAFATLWAAWGGRFARVFTIPLGILYLTMPIWNVIRPTLQTITVAVSASIGRAFDITMFVVGNAITLPTGTLVVEEACSGLNFFLVALTLAALVFVTSRRSLAYRLGLVAAAVACALIANWIRVTALILFASRVGVDHPLVVDHYTAGMVLFGVVIAPLLYVAARDMDFAPSRVSSSEVHAAKGPGLSWFVAVLVCSVLPMAWYFAERGGAAQYANMEAAKVEAETPAAPAGWQPAASEPADWRAIFEGFDGERSDAFIEPGANERVVRYTAWYMRERQDHELINERNRMEGPEGWRKVRTLSGGQNLPCAADGRCATLVTRGTDGRFWLVAYRYRVGSVPTSRALVAKLALGLQRFVGASPRSSVDAWATVCGVDCAAAARRLGPWTSTGDSP